MMKNYRALLIDDEVLLCQYLQNSLVELWPELDVLGMANNGEQALFLINDLKPDVIFLDIKMPKLDGLAVAKYLAQLEFQPLIVFITAYDQHAVEAFEREAIDYLLKPVDENRLRKTVDRVKLRLDEQDSNQRNDSKNSSLLMTEILSKLQKHPSSAKLTWIKAVRQDNIYLISPEDVHYFQAEDKYTTVFTQGEEYIIRTPIKELIAQLDESQFLQIRRGTLVNSKHIEKIHRDFTGRMHVCLKGSESKLQISRSFSANFKQM